MLETLDYTIRICSTPTFLYFDLYLYSAYVAHYVLEIVHCTFRYKSGVLAISSHNTTKVYIKLGRIIATDLTTGTNHGSQLRSSRLGTVQVVHYNV